MENEKRNLEKDFLESTEFIKRYDAKKELLRLFREGELNLSEEIIKELELDDLEEMSLGNSRNWNLLYEGLVNLLFTFSNKEKFVKMFSLHFINQKCNYCESPESDFLIFYHRFYNKLSKRFICQTCLKLRIKELQKEIYPFFIIYSKSYKAQLPSEFLPKHSEFDPLKQSGKIFELEISLESKTGFKISKSKYVDNPLELKDFLQETYKEFKESINSTIDKIEVEKDLEEKFKRKYHLK